MELLPFIVEHVVLMKFHQGPPNDVVRELVAVGRTFVHWHTDRSPHHPRPQRGEGFTRLRCMMIRCASQVRDAHFRNLVIIPAGSVQETKLEQTISFTGPDTQPKTSASASYEDPPYLTTTPSKRHYKNYKPQKLCSRGRA